MSIRSSLTDAGADVIHRRPVWEALSELFLDTDVTLLREPRSAILATSPYTLAELEEILIDEVYPVCWMNLLSVAGEWVAFDQEWLEASILRRLASPMRALHWINLGRVTVPTSIEWLATKRLVERIRSDERDQDVTPTTSGRTQQ